MPYIPPYLMQEQQVVPRSSSVSYGNLPPAFERQEGESELDHYSRLTRTLLPTATDLIKGKPTVEQIAILQSKIVQAQPYASYPFVGKWVKGRIVEYQERIVALQPAAAADAKIQDYKVIGFGFLATAAVLVTALIAVKTVKAFKEI